MSTSFKTYNNHSLKKYLENLAAQTPTPGGGSAAALVGALGVALISMVARYSLKKGRPRTIETKIESILKESEKIRKRLLELVDLDARAYLKVAKTRHSRQDIRKAALRGARDVPCEVARLCFRSVQSLPFLTKHGNRFLLSDIQVAAEFLLAAFNASLVNVEINR